MCNAQKPIGQDDSEQRKKTLTPNTLVFEAQQRLVEYSNNHNSKELLQKFVDEAEQLTRSSIGFCHFLNEDQETLTLQTWSTNTTIQMCDMDLSGEHYPVSKAGVWVDCIHEKKTVIHQCYEELSHRKGLPDGHAPIERELVVPVFHRGTIKAIFGVGNKEENYTHEDAEIVEQFANIAWETVVRKITEEELKLSQQRLKNILIELPTPVFISQNRVITFVNRKMYFLLGYEENELLGKSTRLLFPTTTEFKTTADEIFSRLEEQQEISIDTNFTHKNGVVIDVELTASHIERNANNFSITCLVKNITEETRQAALIQNNRLLHETTERMAKIGSWEWDAQTNSMIWSRELYKIHGYEEWSVEVNGPELIERGLQYYDKADQDRVRRTFLRCIKDGKPFDFECDFNPVDGRRLRIRSMGQPVVENGKVTKIYGNIADITEQKKAENILNSFFEQPLNLNLIASKNGEIVRVNEGWLHSLGFENEELKGVNVLSLIHPDDIDSTINEMQKLVIGTDTLNFENRYRHKDGNYHILNWSATYSSDDNMYYGVAQDITEQQKAKSLLKAHADSLDAIFESVPTVLLLVDKDGRIKKANAQANLLVAHPQNKIVGELYGEVFNCKNTKNGKICGKSGVCEKCPVNTSISSVFQTEQPNYEKEGIVVVEANGEEKTNNLLISSSLISYMGERTALLTITDVTKLKETEKESLLLQKQLYQSQKLESVGRLAGGISHDLNNLLSPILGYSEILVEDLSRGTLRESAEEIHLAAERAGNLIRQLLAFSRKQLLEFKIINLNSILINFKKLLSRTIRENINLKFELAQELPNISGDVGQIEQVLLNLVVNSQDAIAGAGDIVFSTSATTIDEGSLIQFEGLIPGYYIKLSVKDSGCGMGSDIQREIFEPFFTTKDDDKGTGLGLSTVYGIIKQHQGTIWVESNVGEGVTFNIVLPVSMTSDLHESDQPDLMKLSSSMGSETILVVEDELGVRKLIQMALDRRGYKIIIATNGKEAVKTLEKMGDKIDLVLTDVIMPEMDGRLLSQVVQEKYPQIKILFMSGYTGKQLTELSDIENEMHFLRKPFTVKTLMNKVQEIIRS